MVHEKLLVFDSHPKSPRTFSEKLERTPKVEEGSGV